MCRPTPLPLNRAGPRWMAVAWFSAGFVAGVLALTVVILLIGTDPAAGQADQLAGHIRAAAGSQAAAGRTSAASTRSPAGSSHPPRSCRLHAALAAALAPIVRHQTGAFAVGVTDVATGATATYHGQQRFHTASIVKADILAALLLDAQRQHASLPAADRALAAEMIEDSDNAAASALWNAAGAAAGIAAADAGLGLRHTVPGQAGYWGLTATTVSDQLRLLADLASPHSPLTAASRRYELSLMRSVEAGQNWGVTAAADDGTRPAVKNGWLPDGPRGLWVINSIGVLRHHGHTLLIAVLSSGQPSEYGGIRQVQALAGAAAAAVIGLPSCTPA